MKVQIDKERKWDNIQGKRETAREITWYFVKKIGIYVKWMREEFEIKILIYWLYKLCTPAYSQGSFRAGGFQCVSYWFCLNHFIVITQKGLWYFVCEVVNENWWRNFHWFYIFGVYMVYSFIRYQIFLSSKRRKAKIFQYSMGEFFVHEYIWSRLGCRLQCLRSKWSLMCRQTMNLS